MIIVCPHCHRYVEILELNCCIFRHGIFKNGNQIPPHCSLEEWLNFVKNDIIYGCGKPFKIVNEIAIECSFDT